MGISPDDIYIIQKISNLMPEVEIKVKGYKCNNCGNEWLPRSKKEKSLICPKCKSARWDKPPRKKT